MTIDEALKQAAVMQHCWLVWRTDTGELDSIEDADAGPGTDWERSQSRLSDMEKKGPFPTKGRWLPASEVTRKLLQKEAEECNRIKGRVAILEQWAQSPVERLVQILERGEYQRPYVDTDDARYVMELLFDLHAKELISTRRDLRDRLITFCEAEILNPRLNAKLRRQLAVADLDADALKTIWSNTSTADGVEAFLSNTPIRDTGFMEEFGDVRTQDPEIIDWLIATVACNGMFGPRYTAMFALGKIGPTAGVHAVEVIRANIHDSSPAVSNMRELVVKRITTPPNDWLACKQCHRGRVLPPGKFSLNPCPVCKGMGLVHIKEKNT